MDKKKADGDLENNEGVASDEEGCITVYLPSTASEREALHGGEDSGLKVAYAYPKTEPIVRHPLPRTKMGLQNRCREHGLSHQGTVRELRDRLLQFYAHNPPAF